MRNDYMLHVDEFSVIWVVQPVGKFDFVHIINMCKSDNFSFHVCCWFSLFDSIANINMGQQYCWN
jgi:hypothetical protein